MPRGLLRGSITVAAFLAPFAVAAFEGVPFRTSYLDGKGPAQPIAAWSQMCSRDPAECAVDTREPETMYLDSAAWDLVQSVNSLTNREIRAVTDRDHWGVEDLWSHPDDGMGDCEDIQMLKRARLAAAGLPRRAMRMTVVIDETGEGHAVLGLRTDRGDFVLDNRHDRVMPWSATGYVFVKREGAEGTGWVSLGDSAGAVVTAKR